MRDKEAERQHQRNIYREYKARRERLVELFGSQCWLCGKKNRIFNFHHLVIGPYGRYGHASMWRRLQQLREIEESPETFRLVCTPCHYWITKLEHLPKATLEEIFAKYRRLMSIVTHESQKPLVIP